VVGLKYVTWRSLSRFDLRLNDCLQGDAAEAPNIGGGSVRRLEKCHFRRSIESAYDVVRKRSIVFWPGRSDVASKAEISKFNFKSVGVNKDVLRFQVSMDDACFMEVGQTFDDLTQNTVQSSVCRCIIIGFQKLG